MSPKDMASFSGFYTKSGVRFSLCRPNEDKLCEKLQVMHRKKQKAATEDKFWDPQVERWRAMKHAAQLHEKEEGGKVDVRSEYCIGSYAVKT